MDDRQLVAGVASRDPEAFRMLMERYASLVINVAYRFLGTVADAEDAAQDVFLRLYQSPPHLAPGTKLSTWLYRVAVNRSLDLLRKRPKHEMVSLEEPSAEGQTPLAEKLPDVSSTPREQVALRELATLARRAVAALPLPLRAPLLLAAFEELTLEEIGRVLKISPKAAERRIARARELLRLKLAPYL